MRQFQRVFMRTKKSTIKKKANGAYLTLGQYIIQAYSRAQWQKYNNNEKILKNVEDI